MQLNCPTASYRSARGELLRPHLERLRGYALRGFETINSLHAQQQCVDKFRLRLEQTDAITAISNFMDPRQRPGSRFEAHKLVQYITGCAICPGAHMTCHPEDCLCVPPHRPFKLTRQAA
jgi:hypothetical protein